MRWVLGWCWCLRQLVWLSATIVVVQCFALPPPPPPGHNQNTFGPTDCQNAQWREPIGAANGKQPNTEALCQPPPGGPLYALPFMIQPNLGFGLLVDKTV